MGMAISIQRRNFTAVPRQQHDLILERIRLQRRSSQGCDGKETLASWGEQGKRSIILDTQLIRAFLWMTKK